MIAHDCNGTGLYFADPTLHNVCYASVGVSWWCSLWVYTTITSVPIAHNATLCKRVDSGIP